MIDKLFTAEAKRKQAELNINNRKLAEMTRYSLATIYAFYTDIPGRDQSPAVKRAIARALNIEL